MDTELAKVKAAQIVADLGSLRPGDRHGCDAVWPVLEEMANQGSTVVVKIDGERRGEDDNGRYTVVVSGGPLGENFFRMDVSNLEEGLAKAILHFARAVWGQEGSRGRQARKLSRLQPCERTKQDVKDMQCKCVPPLAGWGTVQVRRPMSIGACPEQAPPRKTRERSRPGVDWARRDRYLPYIRFVGTRSRRIPPWQSHVLISSIRLWPGGTTVPAGQAFCGVGLFDISGSGSRA